MRSGYQGLGSCCIVSVSKLAGSTHPAVVEILKFDSFRPLKSCGERMHVSHFYTLKKRKKTSKTLIWLSYRSQYGGQILSH